MKEQPDHWVGFLFVRWWLPALSCRRKRSRAADTGSQNALKMGVADPFMSCTVGIVKAMSKRGCHDCEAMMITLDQYEISVLVTIALAGGQYRAMSNYKTFSSIEHKGLTTVVNRDDVYNAHKLTPAGIQLCWTYQTITSLRPGFIL